MKSKKTNLCDNNFNILYDNCNVWSADHRCHYKYRKATVAANTDKLSNDEIEKLKSERKEDLLSDMKLRFTNGEGSLSILKSYFPDNIVYVNNKNQYVFAQILPELAKNNYKDENFKQDDKGMYIQ